MTYVLFERMKKQGLIIDFSFPEKNQLLAARIVNFGNTWLYATRWYSDSFDASQINDPINSLLSILYPYLTAKGQKEYQELLPELFG